jgi:hypothetical protein
MKETSAKLKPPLTRRASEIASTRPEAKNRNHKKSNSMSTNFFENFTTLKNIRMRSHSKDLENVPYHLLVSNFRRKFILQTIKDKTLTHE